MPPKLSCVADVHLFYVSFNSGVFWHTMPIELNTALPWLGQKSGATHNAPLSIIFRGLYLWGETNSGWLIRKMSGWLPASKGTENRIGAWLYKTMSVRLMTFTEGGNMQKGGKLCQLSWWKTLLRGERTLPYLPGCKRTLCWAGRCWGSSVMWTPLHWCCGPTCHSRSGWGFGRHARLGNLKGERQKTDEQMGYWVEGSMREWLEARESGKGRQRKEGAKTGDKKKEPICPMTAGIIPPSSTQLKYGRIIFNGTEEHSSSNLPLVLCARAKPSSIRKKSNHAEKQRYYTLVTGDRISTFISSYSTTKKWKSLSGHRINVLDQLQYWFHLSLMNRDKKQNIDQYTF